MHSLGSISAIASEKKIFLYLPIWSCVNNMTCGGSHLGYRKSKMAATAGNRLTLDHMGKYSNSFFSETTNMIKAKLYTNVHWMILYNLKVFCSDMKFKMAATAGIPMIIHVQFRFSQFIGFREEDL
jgi:hypothetical protein